MKQKWYINGKRHNDSRYENGLLMPAVIEINGTKEWYINGNQIINL